MPNFTERSRLMNGKSAFIRSQLNIFKHFLGKWSMSTVRRAQDGLGKLMSNSYKDQVKTERIKVGAINCAMLSPKEELSSGVMLYLHGGGYVAGNLDYANSFGSLLAVKYNILFPKHFINKTLRCFI